MALSPFKEKIKQALLTFPSWQADESQLAYILFPDPKSWRNQANGGPPGFQMSLSRALREMHAAGLIGHDIKGPGPGQRIVRLREEE